MSPKATLDPIAHVEIERILADSSLSEEWNDRLKSITETLVGEIPYVGFIVEILLGLLWPSSAKDIWETIKDQVQQAIDHAILTEALKDRHRN